MFDEPPSLVATSGSDISVRCCCSDTILLLSRALLVVAARCCCGRRLAATVIRGNGGIGVLSCVKYFGLLYALRA
jgi:hypothetical protein